MSLRKDIRDAIAATLASPATTLGVIISGRRDDIPDPLLTDGVALVFYLRETAQPEGRNPGRTRLHQADYAIEVHTAASATLTDAPGSAPVAAADAMQTAEDALDAFHTAIETAVHADLTLDGNVITSYISDAEYTYGELDATRVYATLTLTLTVRFRSET
jgi:hypothetical protein